MAQFDCHFIISVSWRCHQALWILVYEQDFCSTNGSFNYHNIWSINILTIKLEWRTAVQQPWGYLKCSIWKCTSCAQFQHQNSELLLTNGVHSVIHYIGFKIYGITCQKVKNKQQPGGFLKFLSSSVSPHLWALQRIRRHPSSQSLEGCEMCHLNYSPMELFWDRFALGHDGHQKQWCCYRSARWSLIMGLEVAAQPSHDPNTPASLSRHQ